MNPKTSDPLPQRVRELVDSVKADLASLPADPQARAAAVVKITAKLDELKKQIHEAPPSKALDLKWLVFAEVAKQLAKGILDIFIRWAFRMRGPNPVRMVWA
jgi:hypothetical protein